MTITKLDRARNTVNLAVGNGSGLTAGSTLRINDIGSGEVRLRLAENGVEALLQVFDYRDGCLAGPVYQRAFYPAEGKIPLCSLGNDSTDRAEVHYVICEWQIERGRIIQLALDVSVVWKD